VSIFAVGTYAETRTRDLAADPAVFGSASR
jgi:hypothetical protein